MINLRSERHDSITLQQLKEMDQDELINLYSQIKGQKKPGTKEQEEIGAKFGYQKDVVSHIINIEINLTDEIRKTIYISFFSNLDKQNIARVEHHITHFSTPLTVSSGVSSCEFEKVYINIYFYLPGTVEGDGTTIDIKFNIDLLA